MPTNLHLVPRTDDMGRLAEAELDAANAQPRIPDAPIQQARREAGCNGNCNQGRACDCVPDYPEPARELMTDGERVALGVVLAVSAFASVAALPWVLPMAWATVKRWI